MGQTTPRQFPRPAAIGSVNRPNDIISQSMAAPTLPQNQFQPLIQNNIPFVATANAVPNGGNVGSNGQPSPEAYGRGTGAGMMAPDGFFGQPYNTGWARQAADSYYGPGF